MLVELRLPSRTRLIATNALDELIVDFVIRGNQSVRFFLAFTGFTIFKQSPSLADKRIAVLFLEVTEIRRYRHAREVIEERYEGKEKNV